MINQLKRQLGHDVHPMVQFIKYGVIGGLSTGISVVVTFYLCWKVIPCLTENDPLVRLLRITVVPPDESVRGLSSVYCNGIGFVVSNAVCYILNRLFVFKPGRHHIVVEFLLFFGVSGLSWGFGTSMQYGLIEYYGMQTSGAIFINILCALFVNFAMRKFVIFKG